VECAECNLVPGKRRVVGCAVHQRTDGLYASRARREYLRDLLHRRDRNGIRQQERDGHDSDADTDADTDANANANTDANTDAGTCTRAGTGTDAGTDTDTDANADTDTDANADTNADTDTNANANTDAIPLGPSGRDQSAAFKQHRHRRNFARHYRGVGDSECGFMHSLGGLG
jgi:hypothetical protein